MTPIRSFFIVCILAFIIWCAYEMFKIWKMPKPTPGRNCDTKGEAWADTACTSINEVKFDPTIISPKGKALSLLKFSVQGDTMLPLYNPVWYRFRYVNALTGGYSDFSDWTPSAVMSGSCCLPCINGVGQCDSVVGTGYATCKANAPTLGIEETQLDYTPMVPVDAQGTYYVPNIHRYVAPPGVTTLPPDDVKDEIVGVINMVTSVADKKFYSFIDVSKPACGTTDTGGVCSKTGNVCIQGDIGCSACS